MDVLEEILPAQNHSFKLGLKLRLPHHEVEGIHSTHIDPCSRLLHVILAFLNQAKPRPTWRVIVDALRSPLVNLTSLADKVEEAHFPDPTSTRDVVTETTSTGIKSYYLLCVKTHAACTISASVQAASPSQRPVVDLPETEEDSTSTSVAGPPDTTGRTYVTQASVVTYMCAWPSLAAATTSGTTATTSTPATPSTANGMCHALASDFLFQTVLMPLSVNSVQQSQKRRRGPAECPAVKRSCIHLCVV